MRALATMIVCAALSGCASSHYTDDYSGIQWQDFRLANETYRVRDKPAESRMTISPDPALATGERFMALAFGTGPVDRPKPTMENAAQQFLAESGRPGCRAFDTYLLASPIWEVKYDCSPQSAAISKPARRN